MKSFSCCVEGWCSLHASLSSHTNFPSFTNSLAYAKATLFNFTMTIHLRLSLRLAVFCQRAGLARRGWRAIRRLPCGWTYFRESLLEGGSEKATFGQDDICRPRITGKE